MDLGGSGDLCVLVCCCMWVVLDIVVIAAIVSSVAIGTCNSWTQGSSLLVKGSAHREVTYTSWEPPSGVQSSSCQQQETCKQWIMPFHLPNIFSIHPVKGSLMPEFSANSNLRDCNHASALATNPSGAVLLGIKVQHVVPIIAYTPPCSVNNISISIYLHLHLGHLADAFHRTKCKYHNR